MTPHKHKKCIEAWANGAVIEVRTLAQTWVNAGTPTWSEQCNYRIKPAEPEKVYPVTALDAQDFCELGFGDMIASESKRLANAAIRRAIEDGQVFLPFDPSSWLDIDGIGTVYGDVNTLSAFAARLKNDEGRDMAVAIAVRTHICVRGTPTDLVLREIIEGVK